MLYSCLKSCTLVYGTVNAPIINHGLLEFKVLIGSLIRNASWVNFRLDSVFFNKFIARLVCRDCEGL